MRSCTPVAFPLRRPLPGLLPTGDFILHQLRFAAPQVGLLRIPMVPRVGMVPGVGARHAAQLTRHGRTYFVLIPCDGPLPAVVCPLGIDVAINRRHAPGMVGEVRVEHASHVLARFRTGGTQRMHGGRQVRTCDWFGRAHVVLKDPTLTGVYLLKRTWRAILGIGMRCFVNS